MATTVVDDKVKDAHVSATQVESPIESRHNSNEKDVEHLHPVASSTVCFQRQDSRVLLILFKDPLDASGDDPNQVHYKTMHWM